MKFYGTEEETYAQSTTGRVWLVQGPDMVDSNPEEIGSVPVNAVQLSPQLSPLICDDLSVEEIEDGVIIFLD